MHRRRKAKSGANCTPACKNHPGYREKWIFVFPIDQAQHTLRLPGFKRAATCAGNEFLFFLNIKIRPAQGCESLNREQLRVDWAAQTPRSESVQGNDGKPEAGEVKAKLMYAITGASGNTGRIVVEHLLAARRKVRAIGRSTERLQALAAKGAEPFMADLSDARSLARAFTGAEAVYLMIPPKPQSTNPLGDQTQISDAITSALITARVERAVTLSSIGADKGSGTGTMVGLHDFEEKLNRIAGLNVLHLRAGYFMENTLVQVPIIQQTGTAAGTLRTDLKIPMVATRDIGTTAARALMQADFSGHTTRELLGQRDLTLPEAASIIGKAIGKSDLTYVHIPKAEVRASLLEMGGSEQFADLLLEMSDAMNAGHMRALEPRSAANTTPTSFEAFVTESWLPVFRAQTKAA